MKAKRGKTDVKLPRELVQLCDELVRLKKQAAQLGLFTDDRELLECPKCALVEDVTFEGMLVTYHGKDRTQKDSGLRFGKAKEGTYRCPSCRTLVKATAL